MTITEFLEARIAEDEATAWPETVIVSGGWPGTITPNCIGPYPHQGCPDRWALPGRKSQTPDDKWWREPDTHTLIREHELTHATAEQRRVLAECAAKRAIVAEHELVPQTYENRRTPRNDVGCNICAEWDGLIVPDGPCRTLRHLAAVYADHPDYDQTWRP